MKLEDKDYIEVLFEGTGKKELRIKVPFTELKDFLEAAAWEQIEGMVECQREECVEDFSCDCHSILDQHQLEAKEFKIIKK